MRAVSVPRRLAVDCAVRIPLPIALQLHSSGCRTVFRYIDRVPFDGVADDRWPINLTTAELAELLQAELCVSLVQYYSTSYASTGRGVRLSRAYGEEMGEIAAGNARALGAPEGVTLWCDAEGWTELPSVSAALQFLDGWSYRATQLGYGCGLYVGSGLGNKRAGWITGRQLYERPRFTAYWRAASIVPQIPRRGWTVAQSTETTFKGLPIDHNMVMLDHRARRARDRFFVIGA